MKNKFKTIKNEIDQFLGAYMGDYFVIYLTIIFILGEKNVLLFFTIILIASFIAFIAFVNSYISILPSIFKTREICLRSVKNDGDNLKYAPKRLKDREMCLEAIKQDPRALQWTPIKLRDKELCITALEIENEKIKSNLRLYGYLREIFEYIPKDIKTYDLYFKLVEIDSFNFGLVPEKYTDYELCLEAVKKMNSLLEDIRDEFKEKVIKDLNIKPNNNDEDSSSLSSSNSNE